MNRSRFLERCATRQDGVVIDLDEKGQIVGIDIQHASEILDLATLETESLPLRA